MYRRRHEDRVHNVNVQCIRYWIPYRTSLFRNNVKTIVVVRVRFQNALSISSVCPHDAIASALGGRGEIGLVRGQ